jgi:hypothetical protein
VAKYAAMSESALKRLRIGRQCALERDISIGRFDEHSQVGPLQFE